MSQVKKFLIASAAVLAIGGVGAATTSNYASANSNGHDNGGHNKPKDQNNKENNMWRVLQFLKDNLDEIKKGGPLLHEHAALAVPLLKAQDQNAPDLSALTAAVDLNSQQIADTLEKLYPGSHDQALDMWRKHINYYTDYLNASKANDTAGKDAAKQKLDQFTQDFPTLLDNISDRLYRAGLEEQLKVHTNGTLAIIDALLAGDYSTVYTKAHQDYEHMTDISARLLLGAKF